MKLIFLRHAETTFNSKHLFQGHFDCKLSHAGIEKTKELKKNFYKKYDYCYCSTLIRARQTAKILNDKIKIKYDKRLIETSFGEWEKTLITEEKLKKIFDDEELPKGAESRNDVKQRIQSFLNDLKLIHNSTDSILIITHGGVISCIKDIFGISGAPLKNLEILEVEI